MSINIDLIINYKKPNFNIKKIFDILNNFDIDILNDFDINILIDFDIDIFDFNVVIVFVVNIMNTTSFKKLIIRCFFNVFFTTNTNIIIKRYRLFENL